MTITVHDRKILRELAKTQFAYSQLPVMEERRKFWTAHNDLKADRPPIHIELWTFEKDLLPPLRCESPPGREMELTILREMTNHERIGDDRVVRDFFPVEWKTWFRHFNLTVEQEHPEDGGVGHQFIHHIKDFPADFEKLGPSARGIDREATQTWKDLVNETIGDILPARMIMNSLEGSLSLRAVHLMGMEAMIFAIMDHPDQFHAFMDRITDDLIAFYKWMEAENLLILNNSDNYLGQGSFGYCSELPRREIPENGQVLLSDLWMIMESQETVSISPQMFKEFFHPCYMKLARESGMISYGCCEPVHTLWDDCISQYPNVRKVSISPWCDQDFMGERLRGSQTIFHRKPSPNFLGVDQVFDEPGFRNHFKETLNAARGCKLEISYRDVYSLCGEPDRAKNMVRIMREMIEDYWQG